MDRTTELQITEISKKFGALEARLNIALGDEKVTEQEKERLEKTLEKLEEAWNIFNP